MRLLWAVLLVFALKGAAQNKAGELISKLPVTRDTAKAYLYSNICNAYAGANPDSGLYWAREGIRFAEGMHWQKAIGYFHSEEGDMYSNLARYDEALKEFDTAMFIFRSLKDTGRMISTTNDIGVAYMNHSRYDLAAPYFFQVVSLAEAKGDKRMAAVADANISDLYYNQSDWLKAIHYNTVAAGLYRQVRDTAGISSCYLGLANGYLKTGDTTRARAYYVSAAAIKKAIGDETGLAQVYTNEAITHTNVRDRLAEQLQAQAIWDRVSPLHSVSINNTGNIGLSYKDLATADTPADKALLHKAESYMKKAIDMSRQVSDSGEVAYFTGVLAELQGLMGDYKDAYENYHKYQDEEDSLHSQESKNKLAALEEQHEVALRDKQIEITRLNLLAEKRRRLILIVGLCLLGVIGILLFFQNRARQHTNVQLRRLNKDLAAAEKVKAKFFAILSHDLRSPIAGFISFLNLQRAKPDLLDAAKVAAHQQKIADYAEGLLSSMEAMLLWSKGQMESFTPEPRPVPVSALFRHLTIFFAGQEGLLSFVEEGELTLYSDDNYVKTILHNLTANALRAVAPVPGGRVVCRAYAAGGSGVALEIRDNGPGMTHEQLRAIEEDRPLSQSSRGFGLHIVRDLARAIGCRITVTSEVGAGTTFHLDFDAGSSAHLRK